MCWKLFCVSCPLISRRLRFIRVLYAPIWIVNCNGIHHIFVSFKNLKLFPWSSVPDFTSSVIASSYKTKITTIFWGHAMWCNAVLFAAPSATSRTTGEGFSLSRNNFAFPDALSYANHLLRAMEVNSKNSPTIFAKTQGHS